MWVSTDMREVAEMVTHGAEVAAVVADAEVIAAGSALGKKEEAAAEVRGLPVPSTYHAVAPRAQPARAARHRASRPTIVPIVARRHVVRRER